MKIYAEVEIEWRGEHCARGMLEAATDGVNAGGEMLAQKIRDNISTQGPPASTPGAFPHMASGDLQQSVRAIVDRRRRRCHVVATAPHAAAVENARPFIRRTYLESKSAMRETVLRVARQKYGHFRIVQ